MIDTQLVFGSINLLLIKLAHCKLLEFWPIQNWWNWVRFARLLALDILFQFVPQMLSWSEFRALWWSRQYLDFVVLKPVWKYAWGHCLLGRPIFDQTLNFLAYILRYCFNINFLLRDAIYFDKCTSFSCRKAAQDAAATALHGQDGVIQQRSLFFLQT